MNGITPRHSRSGHSFWKASQSDCRGRTAPGGPSAPGIPCSTTLKQVNHTFLSCISPRSRRAFAFTTVSFPKLPCSASITVTRSITRKCFACGKPSSAILPTARRLSSINLSSQQDRNGSGRVGLCCCFRMDTRDRGRSIPAAGWSASSNCAPKTISRSVISLLPRSIFMLCAGR